MYIACTNDIICNLVYKILGLSQLCREGVPQLQWPPPVLLTASGANPHFAEPEQTRPHLAVAMISAIIKQSSYLCYYCIYVYILAFLKLVPASHLPCLDSPSCYLQKKTYNFPISVSFFPYVPCLYLTFLTEKTCDSQKILMCFAARLA